MARGVERAVIAVAVIAAGSIALLLPGTSPARAADRDCGDFSSQKQAQAFFDHSRPAILTTSTGTETVGRARTCPARVPNPAAGATAAASARSAHESSR